MRGGVVWRKLDPHILTTPWSRRGELACLKVRVTCYRSTQAPCASSRCFFEEWQVPHRLIQLVRSQNSVMSPR